MRRSGFMVAAADEVATGATDAEATTLKCQQPKRGAGPKNSASRPRPRPARPPARSGTPRPRRHSPRDPLRSRTPGPPRRTDESPAASQGTAPSGSPPRRPREKVRTARRGRKGTGAPAGVAPPGSRHLSGPKGGTGKPGDARDGLAGGPEGRDCACAVGLTWFQRWGPLAITLPGNEEGHG